MDTVYQDTTPKWAHDVWFNTGVAYRTPMEDIDLNPTDNAILDRLQEGRASPTYIADRDDYSRQNVTNRLQRLVEHGYVQRLAPGLYELVEDPRDG